MATKTKVEIKAAKALDVVVEKDGEELRVVISELQTSPVPSLPPTAPPKPEPASDKSSGMEKFLLALLGAPIALLCMRYWYRGIVASVGGGVVTLSHPRVVEVPGVSASTCPYTEDPVPSDVVINLASVEIACQPAWVWQGFEKEGKEWRICRQRTEPTESPLLRPMAPPQAATAKPPKPAVTEMPKPVATQVPVVTEPRKLKAVKLPKRRTSRRR